MNPLEIILKSLVSINQFAVSHMSEKFCSSLNCVVPENIHTPPAHRGSRKFQGVEGCERGKFLKLRGVYRELFFPEGLKCDRIKHFYPLK